MHHFDPLRALREDRAAAALDLELAAEAALEAELWEDSDRRLQEAGAERTVAWLGTHPWPTYLQARGAAEALGELTVAVRRELVRMAREDSRIAPVCEVVDTDAAVRPVTAYGCGYRETL